MMENFKDCYKDDLENAYFDTDDFASVHNIDGEDCTVVLVDMSAEDAKAVNWHTNVLNPKETAINKVNHIVYVRKQELKRKVTANSVILLDGKKMFVWSVQLSEGVYKIVVGLHGV